MTTQELEKIYELTYKYGWIVSEERKENWLSDRAYIEKAKLEGELTTYIDYGLKELIEGFDAFVCGHADLTVAELYNTFETAKSNVKYDGSYDAFFEFLEEWKMPNAEAFLDGVISKQITDANALDMTYKELYNLYPEVFSYIANAIDEVIPELFYNQFRDTRQYSGSRKIIPKAYNKWLDMQSALGLPLNDKIIMFQDGLTFVHFNGSIVEYVLEEPTTTSRKVLDDLSAGPKPEWDDYLQRVLGYNPTERIAMVIIGKLQRAIQLISENLTIRTPIPDFELSDTELVARIKSYGQERQASYSLYVKARMLLPTISAKEFNEIWDSVSPNPYMKVEEVDFTPTHKYKDPKMEGVTIMVTQTTPTAVKFILSYGGTGGSPIGLFEDTYEEL